MNSIVFEKTPAEKFITMLYGEIWSNGKFRFISAAHPPPVVFSRKYNRIVEISNDRKITLGPLGLKQDDEVDNSKSSASTKEYREKYTVNEINLLGTGDILLLHTDGLSDHMDDNEKRFFPEGVEEVLRVFVDDTPEQILLALEERILEYGKPTDDISVVIAKKR